jgi:hypothetical protein
VIRTLAAATVAAGTLLVPSGQAIQPGPSLIEITAARTSTNVVYATTITTYNLFNRPAFPKAIGSAVLVCTKAAVQATICDEYLRLNRGQIVAKGLIVTRDFYRLAITGGTGYYDNIGGTMTVRATGPRTQQVVLNLNAF